VILVCSVCHRVRIGARWEDFGGIGADMVAICPPCLDQKMRQAEEKREAQDRKLLADRKAGYGPGEGDPFRGFREDTK
jgi:hypothetical protein